MDQIQMAKPEANGENTSHDAVEIARVEELLRALSTALRSYRLYGGESPMLDRFVDALKQRVQDLWTSLPELKIEIEEKRFCWDGRTVFPTGGDVGDLPFLFYKDGIRELLFLPGFEEDVPVFLSIVAKASQVKQDEDDLVTLLWDHDMGHFRYQAVELTAEGVELAGSGAPPEPIDATAVKYAAVPEPAADQALRPEDFQETLYFLDEGDLRLLGEELKREAGRDLWADVVAALFDRLEDGSPDRQLQIVRIFGELLPSMLGASRIERAAVMLNELVTLAGRPGLLPAPVLRAIRDLFGQLATAGTVQQLVQTIEDSPETLRGEHLGDLLGFFPPESLATLMRAVETVGRPDVRRVLEQAVERLATANRDEVVRLLGDPDPVLAADAASWVGRLQIGSATAELVRLLDSPAENVRKAAIEALQSLRAATAGKALVSGLEDVDREVRVAAARALSALGYAAARPVLEEAVGSKRIRAADRTEKIAFFEAYGRLAGADGVPLLERILNGKGWLGRGESAEIRASAALGLARVRHPSARAALETAAKDADPVVRNAVARALREETA